MKLKEKRERLQKEDNGRKSTQKLGDNSNSPITKDNMIPRNQKGKKRRCSSNSEREMEQVDTKKGKPAARKQSEQEDLSVQDLKNQPSTSKASLPKASGSKMLQPIYSLVVDGFRTNPNEKIPGNSFVSK